MCSNASAWWHKINSNAVEGGESTSRAVILLTWSVLKLAIPARSGDLETSNQQPPLGEPQ